jgi:hypothetical protein
MLSTRLRWPVESTVSRICFAAFVVLGFYSALRDSITPQRDLEEDFINKALSSQSGKATCSSG